MITSLPNILTLSRIAAIPLIVALFFVDGSTARQAALAVFVLAALTDYFDGRLARSRGEQSAFGRFMDPVADKLLVVALLVLVIAFDPVSGATVIAALVIIAREFLVSGLREFLAALDAGGVPVSRLAKWKTAAQMAALGFLVLGDAGPAAVPVMAIGEALMWLAAVLTMVTGWGYVRASLRHLFPERAVDRPPAPGRSKRGA